MSVTIGDVPKCLPGDFLFELLELAKETARESAAKRRYARRRRIGSTLRPGVATPLWNELVRQALPHLSPYGAKAMLARQLGISRQRLYVCLRAKRACLDAERTLILLCWVHARQQGQPLPWQSGAD